MCSSLDSRPSDYGESLTPPVIDNDAFAAEVSAALDRAVLPYAGTSGHSGTDTSEERAREDDCEGITSKRQLWAILRLEVTRAQGSTWSEFAAVYGLHHGQASSVLSNLHKAGRIARLAERRGRSKVYVLPEYVNGRATEPFKPNGTPGPLDQATLREVRRLAWAEGYKAGSWGVLTGAHPIPNPYEEH